MIFLFGGTGSFQRAHSVEQKADLAKKGKRYSMAKIERCYGISTGTGYLVGSGVTGKTRALDDIVKDAAELLRAHFDVNVVIRFNSNRKSGGAFVADSGMSDKIGITAGLFNSALREMDGYKREQLTRQEYEELAESLDKIEISTCLAKEFLKEASPFVTLTHEFRDFASLDEAFRWIIGGTNNAMLAYIEEMKYQDKEMGKRNE